jgi:Ca-activated chloride channel homolog
MKVQTLALIASVTLMLGVSATPRPADAVSNVRAVTFDVAITDKNGNPVVGLQKPNFRVFEDNVEQIITRFLPCREPLAIVILAEFTDAYYTADAIKSAQGLIQTLTPEAWVALVSFDIQQDIIVDFTHDKAALVAGLNRLQMPYSHEASLSDALYFVLDRLNRLEGLEAKKAIFLLGTGRDTASYRHSYGDVLKKAFASGTTIYSVGLEQSPTIFNYSVHEPGSLTRTSEAGNMLRDIAQATGGLAFFPKFGGQRDAIPPTAKADLRHRYTLGFNSSSTKSGGKLRRIRVEVADTDINFDGKPDKLRARTQEGYYAN